MGLTTQTCRLSGGQAGRRAELESWGMEKDSRAACLPQPLELGYSWGSSQGWWQDTKTQRPPLHTAIPRPDHRQSRNAIARQSNRTEPSLITTQPIL